MSKKAIALMTRMLDLNPKERISALEALADPFFDGIRDQEIEELVSKFKQEKADRANSKSWGAQSRQRRSTKAGGEISPKREGKSKNKKYEKPEGKVSGNAL